MKAGTAITEQHQVQQMEPRRAKHLAWRKETSWACPNPLERRNNCGSPSRTSLFQNQPQLQIPLPLHPSFQFQLNLDPDDGSLINLRSIEVTLKTSIGLLSSVDVQLDPTQKI